jgi:predicted SnoaL-like aldol condensation-catalyzing enzyme
MADAQQNKQIVIAYYTEAFNDKRPEEAVAKYVGNRYIQHNPQAPDGTEAFIQFVRNYAAQFPELHVEIKRAFDPKNLLNPGKKLAAPLAPGERIPVAPRA